MENLQEKVRQLELYEEIFLNSSDPIEIFDPEGFYLEQNPAFRTLTGYSEHELRGKTPALHLGKRVFSRILKGLSQKGKYQGVLISQPKAGPGRHLELSAFSIHDRKAEVAGYIAISRDITQRKKQDEKLKKLSRELSESQILLSNVLEYSTEFSVAATDLDFRILLYNKKAEEMHGYTAEEVIGRTVKEMHTKENVSRERFEQAINIVLEKGKYEYNTTRKTVSGQERTYHSVVFPMRDRHKKHCGYVVFAHDVTNRKQTEERISRSLKEKEILLREIHHRVKNNLQIVSSLLHLQAKQIKDQPYREMFLSSQNRVKTMSLIHQKLYQASDLSSINIGSFIEDLTKNLFRAYQEKSQNILLEMSAEELDFGVNLAIPCGLIITELVSNSLKHAFPGNRAGKIKINLSKAKEEYFISVSDNGVGFPESLDPRNTQTLGLQLVVSLAESQLNGRIELIRGEGTTFNIRVK